MNDELFEALGNLGFTGSVNDRMFKKLRSDGYTGSLPDMLYQSGGGKRWKEEWVGNLPLLSLIGSLYGNGEAGAFYIPHPVVLGEQALFQDAAGTVPVTADGDPVGLMKDVSGNGNDASQATSASRPTYRTDGSLHWLEFDGVDDHLSDGGGLVIAGDVPSYIAVAGQAIGTLSNNDGLYSYSSGGLVSNSARAIDFGSNTSLKVDAISSGVSIPIPDANLSPAVYEGFFATQVRAGYNGGDISSPSGSVNTVPSESVLGRGVLSGGFTSCKIFGFVHRLGDDGEGVRSSVVAYLKALSGVES